MNVKLPVIATLLTLSFSSNAAIITETWSGKVGGSNIGTILVNNEIISWTVTYDNGGTTGNRWLDGPNGIAEFGGGDDTPLTPREVGVGSDGDKDMISDSTYNFGNIFSDLQDGRTVEDHWARNGSMVDHDSVESRMNYDYFADAKEFYVRTPDDLSNINAVFIVYLADEEAAILELWGISRTVNEVPIPAAAWLFGSALIGMGVIQRKRS